MILDCHIYRAVLGRDDLDAGSKILWCYLCTQASVAVLGQGMDLAELLGSRGEVLCWENASYAVIPCDRLGLSRHRYRMAIDELRDKGIYRDDMLYFPLSMHDGGFFELRSKDGMTPLDILLYSWIVDRIEYGGGSMTDVSNAMIATSLGMDIFSVRKRKTGLYAHGWLEAVRQGSMVYCAEPGIVARMGGYFVPKVSSRASKAMRLNLDRC